MERGRERERRGKVERFDGREKREGRDGDGEGEKEGI